MDAPDDKSGKAGGKWWRSTEYLRFILAMSIILGSLITLGVAMLGGYADAPTMAGIFSGWIVAIVAFYFMEQASDRAVDQQRLFVSEDTRKKLDTFEEETAKYCDTAIDRAIEEQTKSIKDKADFWMNRAEQYRNMLIELDPTLKSEEDLGPRD